MNLASQWTLDNNTALLVVLYYCTLRALTHLCRQEEVIAGPFGASRCCYLPGLQDEHYLQTLLGRPFMALVEGNRNLAGKRKEPPHPFVWLGDQCQEAL